jgi:hypothetical protein
VTDAEARTLEFAPEQFDGVAPDYWREVLRYLRRRSTTVATVSELGAHVEDRRSPDDGPDATDVAVYLHHSTLPKLAGCGAIEYDPRSNTARHRG